MSTAGRARRWPVGRDTPFRTPEAVTRRRSHACNLAERLEIDRSMWYDNACWMMKLWAMSVCND